ncbi:MAG: hypothetical protein GKR88_03600 [Flavobacteriaceae bacterium]|nr:MAG: hypothetical protein GKR88_03600 [Flavobacteriaceae bacterium]
MKKSLLYAVLTLLICFGCPPAPKPLVKELTYEAITRGRMEKIVIISNSLTYEATNQKTKKIILKTKKLKNLY